MKKGKKFIIGIVLITFGVVGLFGLFGNTDDKAALAGGSVLLIAGGAALVYLDKKNPAAATKNTVSAPAPAIVPAANVAPAPAAEKKSVPDGEKNYNLFEDVTDGAALCYEYEESLCLFDGAFDHIPGNGGKALTFKQEPENPHDEKAVAVYLNGAKIGYIYRGTVQDMFNDYTKRGWRVSGYLNKYSVSNNKATYKIGFYKPLDIFESKRFSLSKIKKKIDEYTTREDNLLNCDEGDVLTIEYEDADDCFVVFNDIYEEVGELPKSAANFINENEHKKIVGILDACGENDDGKTKAQITVYLVK